MEKIKFPMIAEESPTFPRISEEPFVTIQGEGQRIGQCCCLVRFEGCNLRCAWCDSSYTWNTSSRSRLLSFSDIPLLTSVRKILITGGEPLLQMEELVSFFNYGAYTYNQTGGFEDCSIEIETNGTIDIEKNYFLDWCRARMCRNQVRRSRMSSEIYMNVSPKLDNLTPLVINNLSNFLHYSSILHPIFKFIIKDDKDIDIVLGLISDLDIPKNLVYLQPLHNRRHSLRKKSLFVLEKCLDNGLNFSPRLQIYLFNDNESQWIAKKKIEYKNMEKLP